MYRNAAPPVADGVAFGGAPDFGSPLDHTTGRNLLIAFHPFQSLSDKTLHGIGYWRNEASGNLDSARMGYRGGLLASVSADVVQIVSTSALDVGRKARLVMESGSVMLPSPELLTSAGTTPVSSLNVADIGKLWRVEALDSGDAPSQPVGNWTISIGGMTLGVIYGTAGATTYSPATFMATGEYELALATALDTDLSSADRIVAPTGISAFSRAVRFQTSDQSLSVPGGLLTGGNHYIGFCEKRYLPLGAPAPLLGYLDPKPILIGYPLS
jgi:hypothetical protein